MNKVRVTYCFLFVFVLGFGMAGCVSLYDKLEAFSVVKLNENTVRLWSYYSYSTEEEAFDMAILKASQVTLKRKKSFFIIKKESVMPNIVNIRGGMNWYHNRSFFWGAPIWGYTHVVEKDISLIIEILDNDENIEKLKTITDQTVVDARLVARELKEKYQL